MTAKIPPLESIGPDTPLRLPVAAAVAFPDGSMTVSGLRRERDRGRLAVEQIAGKDYTTLAAIDRMREQCRVAPKAQDFTSNRPGSIPRDALSKRPYGSSGTGSANAAQAAARKTLEELKKPSPTISPQSTRSNGPQNVVPMKSS